MAVIESPRTEIMPAGPARDRILRANLSSYAAKVAAKAVGGWLFASPVLIVEAVHGLKDILDQFLLRWVSSYGRKAPDHDFPIGRRPILHVTSLTIGVLIVLLGLDVARNGLGLLGLWQADSGLVALLTPEAGRVGATLGLALSAVVLIGSGVISAIQYRFVVREARAAKLSEYLADARELKGDIAVEGLLASALLLAVVAALLPEVFSPLEPWGGADAIVGLAMVLLALWLVWTGVDESRQALRAIMNPGLPAQELSWLEGELREHLEQEKGGSDVILAPSLTAYERSGTLVVRGAVVGKESEATHLKVLCRELEGLTRRLMSDHDFEDVQVDFRVEWAAQGLEDELHKLLHRLWGPQATEPLTEVFQDLRCGRTLSPPDPGKEVGSLGTWLRVQVLTFDPPEDPAALSSQALLSELDGLFERLGAGEVSPNSRTVLVSAALVILSESRAWKGRFQLDRVETAVAFLHRALTSNEVLDPYAIAEGWFALGLHHERRADSELSTALDCYRRANRAYAEGDCSFEADRLLTTWGHHLTLRYDLTEADMRLGQAHDLKKKKLDLRGQAISAGTMGDLKSRLGKWSEAQEFYEEDLRLCSQIGDTQNAEGVRIKLAETLVRKAIVEELPASLKEADRILREVTEAVASGETRLDQFFAAKALAKTVMYRSLHPGEGREELLDEASDWVDSMREIAHPGSDWEMAHVHRLEGRHLAMRGRSHEALTSFRRAQAHFRSVTLHALPVQEMMCRLEASVLTLGLNQDRDTFVNLWAEWTRLLEPRRQHLGPLMDQVSRLDAAFQTELEASPEASEVMIQPVVRRMVALFES